MYLFDLYALSVELKSEKKLIKKTSSLFFSSEEKAAQAAKEYRHHYACMYDSMNTEELYCIIVEGRRLDSIYQDILCTKVYSPDGQLIDSCEVPDGESFQGRKKESLFHQPGDIVEIPLGEELCLGIVLGLPPLFKEDQSLYGLSSSDDSYTLLVYPSLEVDYAHAPLVFKPRYKIDEAVKQSLLLAWKKHTLQSV